MSGIRSRLSVYDEITLYRKVLVDIYNNYKCDKSSPETAREHELHCRACKAKMAIAGKDPWYEDIQTFHLDELPAGKYIAYVDGYNDKGTVSFELQPKGGKINLKHPIPFEPGSVTVQAETEVKPVYGEGPPSPICGGDILEIEIVEPEGYKVLKKLNRN